MGHHKDHHKDHDYDHHTHRHEIDEAAHSHCDHTHNDEGFDDSHDSGHNHHHDHHDNSTIPHFLKTHKWQTASILGSVLVGTTALFTPFIAGALVAGTIVAGSCAALKYTTDATLGGALASGKQFNMSPMSLGLAVGALNTVPETIVSLGALFGGYAAIGIGNIVGSSIAHNLLILGGTAAVAGIASTKKGIGWKFNMAVMTGGTALFGAQLIGGALSPVVGLGMLGLGGYYIKERLRIGRLEGKDKDVGTCLFHDHGDTDGDHAECGHDHGGDGSDMNGLPTWFKIGWTLAGFTGLALSAKLLVVSGASFAATMGISAAIIGTVVVALGTAIPELAINIKAALGKHTELAVGNVIGCNIFNTLIAGGIVALSGAAVPAALGLGTGLGLLNTGTFLGSTAILAGALMIGKGTMKKWQGYAALGIYGAFTAASMWLNDGKVQNLHQHGFNEAAHNDHTAHVISAEDVASLDKKEHQDYVVMEPQVAAQQPAVLGAVVPAP